MVSRRSLDVMDSETAVSAATVSENAVSENAVSESAVSESAVSESAVSAAAGAALLPALAQRFCHAPVLRVDPLGNGNINDTFRVTLEETAAGGEGSGSGPVGLDLSVGGRLTDDWSSGEASSFVLQRLNRRVFPRPDWVMANLRRVTDHARDRLGVMELPRRWEVPVVLPTLSGGDFWQDEAGEVWRALSFVRGGVALEAIADVAQAEEVGVALGIFHGLISDLEPEALFDTLPGFHVTPHYWAQYLEQYQQHCERSPQACSVELAYALRFVTERSPWISVLEDAKTSGKLPLRLMHGDPKVNNVLLDQSTRQALSLIDLDTVKPGLIHYDIGDCIRSACNPLGEETQDWEAVRFESDLCAAVLRGYGAIAHQFLTAADYDYLYDSIRLIAFELGLRFLTDYLAGNVYFKVTDSEHNLRRALVQFKLTESIEHQAEKISQMVRDLR